MTKTNTHSADGPTIAPGLAPDGSEASAAITEALTTQKAPTPTQAALAHLRTIDEEANVVWMTTGPRKSRTTEIAGIMVEIEGVRRIIVVTGLDSGAFKLHAEVIGRGAEAQISGLKAMYGG